MSRTDDQRGAILCAIDHLNETGIHMLAAIFESMSYETLRHRLRELHDRGFITQQSVRWQFSPAFRKIVDKKVAKLVQAAGARGLTEAELSKRLRDWLYSLGGERVRRRSHID